MNLNKWLCKTFDTDEKGYVTIGDVLYVIAKKSTIPVIAIFDIYLLYRGYIFIANKSLFDPDPNHVDIIGIVGVLTNINLFIFIGIPRLLRFKIAKCTLKENENK